MSLTQLQIVIAQLEKEIRLPEDPSEADIQAWRERIDEIDKVLVVLLNERSRSANVIGMIKKRLGLPIYVPQREEEVLALVRTTNNGPLPDESIRRLFERIIDETRSLERKKYQGNRDSD